MVLVLVVANVLQQQLPVLAVVLPAVGCGMVVGIVPWGLMVVSRVLQVVFFQISKLLFGGRVAGFNGVVGGVLVVEGFFKILFCVAKGAVEDLIDVLQLTANTAG